MKIQGGKNIIPKMCLDGGRRSLLVKKCDPRHRGSRLGRCPQFKNYQLIVFQL